GKTLRSFGAAMGGGITCVAWGNDPGRFITGRKDGTVSFHDASTGKTLHELVGPRELLHGLAFSRDGKQLAALTGAGAVKIWSGDGQKELAGWSAAAGLGKPRSLRGLPPITLAWSPDGRRLALGTADRISIRAALTGKEEQSLDADGQVLAWAPDGK